MHFAVFGIMEALVAKVNKRLYTSELCVTFIIELAYDSKWKKTIAC